MAKHATDCRKTKERGKALSRINRPRRRVRRGRGDFCGGKSHFPEQKSFPCSFRARKSVGFQRKLERVAVAGAHEARAQWAKQREVSPMSKGVLLSSEAAKRLKPRGHRAKRSPQRRNTGPPKTARCEDAGRPLRIVDSLLPRPPACQKDFFDKLWRAGRFCPARQRRSPAPLALAAILGRNCLCSKDFAGNARCT